MLLSNDQDEWIDEDEDEDELTEQQKMLRRQRRNRLVLEIVNI